jgi:hypothetical protein
MTNSMLFEGPILEEVLSEARLCFGSEVEIEAANRVRRGGLFGFFASEWYEVWARPSAALAANPALALLDEEEEPDSFQQMVRNAISDRRLGGGTGPETPEENYESALDDFFGGDDASPAVRERELVGVATGSPAVRERELVGVAAGSPATGSTEVAEAAPAATPMLAADAVSAAVALEDAPRGASVFAPQRAAKTDLLWAMLDRLDAVPTAPPLPRNSGLVVFVGEAATALETARRMGERHQLWNGDVAVLTRSGDVADVPSWLVIDDLDELANRAARWRQRDGVVPVVLDQGVEAVERAWAAKAITAIEADQVRMVVEAWRLTEDVGRLAGKLGGVDALELVAVADTVEPLAMLDLGIPLGSIEGRPATADLLAAVWLENRRRA